MERYKNIYGQVRPGGSKGSSMDFMEGRRKVLRENETLFQNYIGSRQTFVMNRD
jgi:hypothetical protein